MKSFSTHRLQTFLGPLYPILIFWLLALLLFSLSRLALELWQFERVHAVNGLYRTMIYGLRIDSATLSYITLLPATLAPLLIRRSFTWSHRAYQFLLVTLLACLLFMELATPSYISEYDLRPGQLFFEYLLYPQEVFSTLWSVYHWQLFGTFLASGLLMISSWRLFGRILSQTQNWPWIPSIISLPLIFIALALGARNTLDHRPMNAASVAFASDHLINELCLNSTYSLLDAVTRMRHEGNARMEYGDLLSPEKVVDIIRKTQFPNDTHFLSEQFPTWHHQTPSRYFKQTKNLVILLEESLGATYVESLGGLPLTPQLERLKHKGIWFERLYATGTRSVRGIEALITGLPPTPGESIIKLSNTPKGVFTLAYVLKQKNYHTTFIYGGNSHFDNMRSFFLSNGFDRIIDQPDFVNPVFSGSWGVSDEDMLNRSHEEIKKMHKSGKPFFLLSFSTSNHTPFEFPDDRITLYEPTKATHSNAAKYADYAIGQFIDKAQQEEYWKDTLFLIVADHDTRVFGASRMPVERFHIPGLIMGSDIGPDSIKDIVSQIDLPTTLLSLMGVESDHPMIGRDLSKANWTDGGRAIMQYDKVEGYLKNNKILLFSPNSPVKQFTYHAGAWSDEEKIDHERAEEASAMVLLPSDLYFKHRYPAQLAEH